MDDLRLNEYLSNLHELDLAGIAFDVRLHIDSDDFRDGIPVDDMVDQLEHVIRPEVVLSDSALRRYLERFFELMTVQGSGPGFGRSTGFIQAAETAIGDLDRSGAETAHLWLALAQYHAMMQTRRSERLRCIRRSLRASANRSEQRIRALLSLAEYHTDFSHYWLARRILRQCDRMLPDDAGVRDVRALALARLGITYFYSHVSRAQKLFALAINVANGSPKTPESFRALALAHHYLGRILTERRGEHAKGLECLVRGQAFKERVAPEQMQLGYYNLRLGETLHASGNRMQAWQHFGRSSELFQKTHAGIGLAHLYAAQARVFKKDGDLSRAEDELRNAVQIALEAKNSRPSLLFMVQLGFVQAERREYAAAVRTLAKAAMPLLVNGGASVRLIRAYSRTRAGARAGLDGPAEVVACPCPEHAQGWVTYP
jgi:tetratricopeptide (TPR) repeat protein